MALSKPVKNKKRGRGQPTKLDDATARYITEALSVGISVKRACLAAGTSCQNYYNWCKQNVDFFDMTTRAKLRGEITLLLNMRDAASGATNGDWRAAEALLKCMYPRRYAKHVVNHEGRKLPGDGNDVGGELADQV